MAKELANLPSVTPQEPTNKDLTCAYAKGVYDTREETATILDKIRAEIELQETWLMIAGYNAYNADIAFNAIKSEVAKYKADTEDTDGTNQQT